MEIADPSSSASLRRRPPVVAVVGGALLCFFATALPCVVRTGRVGFSSLDGYAVVPSAVYLPYCASIVMLGVLHALTMHGHRAPLAAFVTTATVPLLIATMISHQILSPFPSGSVTASDLPYRAAALAAPDILGAGALSSASLFALLGALWFLRSSALAIVADVPLPRFDAGTAVVAWSCVGVVTYLHHPWRIAGQLKSGTVEFSDSMDAAMCSVFVAAALGAPFAAALLRRASLLEAPFEEEIRSDAVAFPLSLAMFAAGMALLCVCDSRVRCLTETATYQPFVGQTLWYGMMLLRVVLALLVAGSGFFFVRRTGGGRARGYGLMLSVSVIVLAMLGALTMDASEGGREEHAFRTTVAG